VAARAERDVVSRSAGTSSRNGQGRFSTVRPAICADGGGQDQRCCARVMPRRADDFFLPVRGSSQGRRRGRMPSSHPAMKTSEIPGPCSRAGSAAPPFAGDSAGRFRAPVPFRRGSWLHRRQRARQGPARVPAHAGSVGRDGVGNQRAEQVSDWRGIRVCGLAITMTA